MYIYHQVILPSLHISLGVFKKLFDLFESNCHELDGQLFKLRTQSYDDDDDENAGTNFEEQIASSVQKRNTVAQQLREKQSRLDELEDDLPLYVLQHTEQQEVDAEFRQMARDTYQLRVDVHGLVSITPCELSGQGCHSPFNSFHKLLKDSSLSIFLIPQENDMHQADLAFGTGPVVIPRATTGLPWQSICGKPRTSMLHRKFKTIVYT